MLVIFEVCFGYLCLSYFVLLRLGVCLSSWLIVMLTVCLGSLCWSRYGSARSLCADHFGVLQGNLYCLGWGFDGDFCDWSG